ncbi:MAG: hypothetical protein IIX94_00870, partial [Clostridia bacterium]|nr:hypothetical protein [Clostridia bacterium]
MSDFNYENNNENEINETERKREERAVRLKNRTPLFVILTVILLLVALFIGYDMGRSVGRGPSTRPANPATSTTTPSGAFAPTVIAPTTTIEIPKSDSPVAEPVEGSYVYVNDKVASSVVSITTEA